MVCKFKCIKFDRNIGVKGDVSNIEKHHHHVIHRTHVCDFAWSKNQRHTNKKNNTKPNDDRCVKSTGKSE